MNKPIRTMAVFVLLLFGALLVNVTWLQYVEAGDLNDRAGNRRVQDAAFSQDRGSILVGRRPIATSKPSNDRFDYQRVYPAGPVYAPLTGFFNYFSASQLEQTENAVLSGDDSRFFVRQVVDLLDSAEPQGGSVSLTVDARAQQAAWSGLRNLGEGTKGAVVALEPATGKVLAMVSNPTYDPNVLATHDLSKIQRRYDRLLSNPDNPLVNRAVSTTLPPGSTFKLVTAAAALSSGQFTPQSAVPGGATLDLPQTDTDLPNENGATCGGEEITLTQALAVSCNVAFGWLGLQLGAEAISDQARRFGFEEDYLPELQQVAQSRFPRDADEPQAALSAIGQFDVAATPLQMAMVTAAIANNGTVMQPYLVDTVTSPDFQVLSSTEPTALRTDAVSPSVARDLTQMMVNVVTDGTAGNAAIEGVSVAGKTGTAQSAPNRPPYAWFVSFAPAENPRVAVAVLVEDVGVARDAISGGGLAAPIAKAVMEAVLR